MGAAKAFLAEELTGGMVTARDLCLNQPNRTEKSTNYGDK
ncbi:hypothetical protein PCPL58_p5062 (plasmid) [Pseudomonas cerasi]|nr:hypothetical protein PCPL58_p5062 [Pseudomonas cerasi]